MACSAGGLAVLDVANTDYITFCGGVTKDWIKAGLTISDTRISASDLKRIMDAGSSDLRLMDVRSPIEFGICHLPGSISESFSRDRCYILMGNRCASSNIGCRPYLPARWRRSTHCCVQAWKRLTTCSRRIAECIGSRKRHQGSDRWPPVMEKGHRHRVPGILVTAFDLAGPHCALRNSNKFW